MFKLLSNMWRCIKKCIYDQVQWILFMRTLNAKFYQPYLWNWSPHNSSTLTIIPSSRFGKNITLYLHNIENLLNISKKKVVNLNLLQNILTNNFNSLFHANLCFKFILNCTWKCSNCYIIFHCMCSHLQVPLNNSKLKTVCKNMLYVYMFIFIMKINI
jgi:hypothetical protein